MKRESPFSEFRALRELQYAWLYYFLSLQYSFLGEHKDAIHIEIQKGLWSDTFGILRKKFFGKLLGRPRFLGKEILVRPEPGEDYSQFAKKARPKILEFPEGVVSRETLNEEDQAIFDFLAQDWNQVYKKERDKATILGYIAEYMLDEGADPDEIKTLTLPEFSAKAESYNLPGLADIDGLMERTGLSKEQTYGLVYAQAKGAEWLAIYDQNGNRSGRAYDLITKMYREQIAEALARNATESEIRSLMVSPDDDSIREALGLFEVGISDLERSQREADYENLVRTHLNRDMQRFAYTETAINFNNGLLLMHVNEGKGPQYVKFSGGNY
ncbi:hypothetical protein EHO57_13795 [Leptospira langatensis]|uniref:Uncharacterized protein n=1 Tax=Leptospira langatensis TaxID=2484983 RepID=A0A5R2ATE3_9LEPT|nr:hypothetical protein [Leptospira langatensis]TGJ99830.1 hypothetical protein EHO57_13795 [Leptospira langatensis]